MEELGRQLPESLRPDCPLGNAAQRAKVALPESIQEEILHLAGMLPISYRLRHNIPPKRLTSLPTINVCAAQLEMMEQMEKLEDFSCSGFELRLRNATMHNGVEYSHMNFYGEHPMCHAELHETFISGVWVYAETDDETDAYFNFS